MRRQSNFVGVAVFPLFLRTRRPASLLSVGNTEQLLVILGSLIAGGLLPVDLIRSITNTSL